MNASGGSNSARPLLAIAAAAVLIGSFFLPWVTWGSYSGSLASSFSREMSTGQGWLTYSLLVGGAVVAAIASVLRAGNGGTSRGLAAWAAAGFAASLGGFALFMVAWDNYAGALTYSGYSIGVGVWIGAIAAVLGLIVAFADRAGARQGASVGQPWSAALSPKPELVTNWPGAGPTQTASPTVGRISYVEGGRPLSLVLKPGQQVIIGRGATAGIRLSDAKVSREHALIAWSGSDWVVRDLKATNPTSLLGASGTAQPIMGEARMSSGQLLIGEVLVTLFPAGS
jgi:FHA domain